MCGTDLEISQGEYGWAPPGHERLVLGHESLGRVLEAPDGSDLAAGDLVVGIVRQPDPEPCVSCGLVADLGATYHTGTLADAVGRADVVVECTGVGQLLLDAIDTTGPDGIVCLTAATALAEADQSWLQRLITRRVPLGRWSEALQWRPDDVKAIIDLGV